MKQFKKINYTKKDIGPNESEYVFQPFERGIATTIGNSLRRTLLSSLSSYSVVAIRVKNAKHEYTSIEDVVEDLPNIILNIKKIAFSVNDALFDGGDSIIELKLESKKGKVLAGDITCPTGISIVNKDLYIATTDSDGALVIDFLLEKNRGYDSFSTNNDKNSIPLGYIGVDAIYSPVVNVSYDVEELNTHKILIEEMLKIRIKTNGSITPDEALDRVSKILIAHFKVFLITSDSETDSPGKNIISTEEEKQVAHYYNWPIEHLNLNIRTYNSLKRANINLIKDILEKNKNDLEKLKNFGDRAFSNLIQALKHKKIDTSKFE